jgi:prepilin-type N-terminal cleavage/methylation domain-containing protein
MKRHNKKGFTLVEIIITSLIIAILAAVTGGIIVVLMQLFMYLPRDMSARMVAHDISDQIVDGQTGSRGLRYAFSITTAQDNLLTYTVGYPSLTDQYNVTFTYDTTADKIYMKIGSGSNATVPYYALSGINVTCPSSKFFTYYKKDGTAWTSGGTDTYNIGRVEATYTVSTGTGDFDSAEGSLTTTTGTDIKQYI